MPRSPSGASARPSPRVSIKSLELNALHTSQIQDMVHLNGNRSSLTSAGQIVPAGNPPYFVIIDRALRDEGTSYHYAAPELFACLLYTSDAADDLTRVDLGGR